MAENKPFSDVERVLRNHVADSHLESLVAVGCDRTQILAVLDLAFWADESWEALTGMDLRAFKNAIREFRDCAAKIERLDRSELIYHASNELRLPECASVQDTPTLPERLRGYASMLDLIRRVSGPKRGLRLDTWKAWIVAIVTEDTKRSRDPEVSALISAVLNKKYYEKTHQQWRLRHQDLIKRMGEVLQKHRHQHT